MVLNIIGFGFSGLSSFANIIEGFNASNHHELIINIISPENNFVTGMAYSEANAGYYLNVPACKMSLFASNSDDYVNWLNANEKSLFFLPTTFTDRYTFGKYLLSSYEKYKQLAIAKNITVNIFHDEALYIQTNRLTGKLDTISKNNGVIISDQIFVCIGFENKNKFKFSNSLKENNKVYTLWNLENMLAIMRRSENIALLDQHIIIIGTGLSVIDILMKLNSNNFPGKITCISKKANYPKPYNISSLLATNLITANDAIKGLSFILFKIRNFLKVNSKFSLADVISGLRNNSQAIWQNLSLKDQKKFINRLLPYWNIFRHRMLPQAENVLNTLMSQKRLKVIKGKVTEVCSLANNNMQVSYTSTTSNSADPHKIFNLEGTYLMAATGADLSYEDNSFVNETKAENIFKKELLGFSSDNKNVILIGAMNSGVLFESTSVHELRMQAEYQAERFLNGLTFKNPTLKIYKNITALYEDKNSKRMHI